MSDLHFERDGLGLANPGPLYMAPVAAADTEQPEVASDDPAHDETTCRICRWIRAWPSLQSGRYVITHGPPIPNENAEPMQTFEVTGNIVPEKP